MVTETARELEFHSAEFQGDYPKRTVIVPLEDARKFHDENGSFQVEAVWGKPDERCGWNGRSWAKALYYQTDEGFPLRSIHLLSGSCLAIFDK